jgi:hypothetical protein
VELVELDDGGFIASKWNLLRALPDIEAAEKWLDMIGAPR